MAKTKKRPERMRSNLSAKQIRQLLAHVGGLDPGFRGNLTEPQVRKTSEKFVSGHLDPLRDETMKAIERRSVAGTGAISGYTKEHEAQLGKIPGMVDADFARARADQQASQEALSGFLQGRGQAAGDELATKFQAAGIEQPPQPGPGGQPLPVPVPSSGGPPPPMPPGLPPDGGPDPATKEPIAAFLAARHPSPGGGPTPDGGPPGTMPPGMPPGPPQELLSDRARAFGHGAAGEAFAGGFAGLARNASEGAGQAAYAHELPGIAALGGARDARALQLQLNREGADAMGAINAQAPGMALDEGERLRDRNLAKAGARGSALNAFLDRELSRQATAGGLGLDYEKLAATERMTSALEGGRNARASAHERAANQRAMLTQQGLTTRQANRLKQSGRTYDQNLSRQKGHLVDKKGRPIKRNGKWIPFKEPPKGNNNAYG